MSKVVYSDQLLCAARQIHVVYSDQLLGAAHHIHLYLITIDRQAVRERQTDKYNQRVKQREREKNKERKSVLEREREREGYGEVQKYFRF